MAGDTERHAEPMLSPLRHSLPFADVVDLHIRIEFVVKQIAYGTPKRSNPSQIPTFRLGQDASMSAHSGPLKHIQSTRQISPPTP